MRSLISYLRYVKEEKLKYRRTQARVGALPKEYRFVYHRLRRYMWNHAGGDSGVALTTVLADLLDLFEAGVADGKRVLDVTGTDVAQLCDELLGTTKLWTAQWHEALNHDIARRLGKGNESR